MKSWRVPAEWAWVSKEPDAGIGYGILAASNNDLDFGEVISRYATGSPSSTVPPGAPDAPPWVTFGPFVTRNRDVLISLSARDPWRHRDHADRPIWPQRIFLLRFADLAAADASYQTLWAAAEGVTLPPEDRAPLPLTVSAQRIGDLVGAIEYYGFDHMAALAAAVLEGRVVVTDAVPLRREQRLALLDAVAALLPYGFRAGLSVSSSVDNTTGHEIRLVFADFANDQQPVSLVDPSPMPGTETGRRYLEILWEKVRPPGPGLLAVLEHLWADKRSHSFEHPAAAISVLEDLDFHAAFKRALREERASRGQSLKFFQDSPAVVQKCWQGHDMSEQMRDYALSVVLAHLDGAAASAVLTRWAVVASDLARFISRRLEAGDVSTAAWCLDKARSAESAGAEDYLLGNLLVPASDDPEDWRQRISARVGLLRQRAVPAPGSLPDACHMLRYGGPGEWQALLVRELLGSESSADPGLSRALGWADWLCRSPFSADYDQPGWVAALGCVLPRSAIGRSAGDLQSLVRCDAAWAAIILRLARRTGRTRDLVETAERAFVELAAGLERIGAPSSAGGDLLRELMIDTWGEGVRPDVVATVDAARILLGGEPRGFPGDVAQITLDGYGDGLGHVFALDAVRPRHAALESGLLHHAVPARSAGPLTEGTVWLLNTWSADAARAPGLVRHIAGLDESARPYSLRLSAQYWSALARDPRLLGYASAQRLIAATTDAVRSPQTVLRRTVTEHGVAGTELALACFAGRRAGLSVSEIIRVLGTAHAADIPPRELDRVLREFQGLLYFASLNASPHTLERDPGRASEDDLDECDDRIMRGAFGAEYGRAFAGYQAYRLQADIRRRQAKLQRIPRGRRGRAVPVSPASAEPRSAVTQVLQGDQAEATGQAPRPARWRRLLAWLTRRPRDGRPDAQEPRPSWRRPFAWFTSKSGDGE